MSLDGQSSLAGAPPRRTPSLPKHTPAAGGSPPSSRLPVAALVPGLAGITSDGPEHARALAIASTLAAYLAAAPRQAARRRRRTLVVAVDETVYLQLRSIAAIAAALPAPQTALPMRAVSLLAGDLLAATLSTGALQCPALWAKGDGAPIEDRATPPTHQDLSALPLDELLARYLADRVAHLDGTTDEVIQLALARARELLASIPDEPLVTGPALPPEPPSMLTPCPCLPAGRLVPFPCLEAQAEATRRQAAWRRGDFPDGLPPSPEAIRRRRELLGWRPLDLAGAAAMNPGVLSKIETNRRHTPQLRARLALVLNEALARWQAEASTRTIEIARAPTPEERTDAAWRRLHNQVCGRDEALTTLSQPRRSVPPRPLEQHPWATLHTRPPKEAEP